MYQKEIQRALKSVGRYNKGLEAQIMSLAGALRTIDLANSELDDLESTTITEVNRYGKTVRMAHPVFKTLRDAQESATRQMKALGLTSEDLQGTDDNDPMVELTKDLMNQIRRKAVIIRPDQE